MTSTHTQYRRNSSASPYTIPIKHQQHYQQAYQQESKQNGGGPISTSVPSLSREFVVRRISEGETGRLKEELKCEACGKGYKHISSLAKHLWEHTPEWNVTKKLLISKHQQVQLLEAASILVGMNETNEAVLNDENPLSPSVSADPGRFNPSEYNPHKTRSHSISQYPPSHHQHNINTSQYNSGGYLDTTNFGKFKHRSNSIAIQEDDNDEDGLKSPPASYQESHINGSIKPTPSPLNVSSLSPSNQSMSSPVNITISSDSFEDEAVVGKLE